MESGLHEFLGDDPELVELAGRFGVELRDLRRPPAGLSVPTGANLEVPAQIVLTVGSDCAIGKMTVTLELDREARARGLRSVFVPTGQTGMAIAGWGIAVDAVVADFIAGAAERLVVEGVERGGELLLVEGQGSLVHPAYSGVTLGLLHGAAPHAFVLCHRAGATEIDDHPGHPLPSLAELVELHERISLPARPAARGVHRSQHARARRRGGAHSDRRRLRPRPASRPTTRCGSAPVGSSTRHLRGSASGLRAWLPAPARNGRYRGEMRSLLRRLMAFAAVLVCTLAAASVVLAAEFGANDDGAKYAADGGESFYAAMAGIGLDQSVINVRWQPSDPATIPHQEHLDRIVPIAGKHGIRIVFALSPYPPREIAVGLATPGAFAALGRAGVARRYPQVRQFIIGNEPNQPAFWRPQFGADGRNVSAAAFGGYLAASYDALKAVDPTITVVGVGLSPRGNDKPKAVNNISTSPVRFIAALGAWYRGSGRERPLMDGFSFHPYPNRATDPLELGYDWPKPASSTSIASSRRCGTPSTTRRNRPPWTG